MSNTDEQFDATGNAEFDLACDEYFQEGEKEKAAKKAKAAAVSKIVLAMGQCKTAWGDNYKVSNKGRISISKLKK